MAVRLVKEAIDRGDPKGLRELLVRDPALVMSNVVWGHHGDKKSSPLHYVGCVRSEGDCQSGDPVALAQVLVNAGANIESRASGTKPGETVLQTAVGNCERALVEYLLDIGADIEAKGGRIDDGTPLVLAVHFAATEVVDLLANRGALIFNLPLAAGVGDIAFMERFFTIDSQLLPQSGARHPESLTPAPLWNDAETIMQKAFVYACTNGREDVARMLVQRGADPNGYVDNATALHWTAWSGPIAMVRWLLGQGANPSIPDRTGGGKPRDWARMRGRSELERLLAQQEQHRPAG